MPKVGYEPIRRQQLIDATLNSVAELGLKATTINTISKRAGLSSGIISHYFGSKNGLIEATVRYLLTSLKSSLISKIDENISQQQRLMLIVEANFSVVQKQAHVTKTWLSFWAESMHDEQLHRLQAVNAKRLYSNLLYSFKTLLPYEQALQAATLSAAMIDGLWLRAVLTKANEAEFSNAELLAKNYVNSLIPVCQD
ncbi:MAG: transcriptional regulator BetI [Pseudomonadota bacterium]|uniref:HTH-type transcriptional regulator BetI n=1 Tax=Pseudoalteromonas spongiae TaxID=298657 RepID=A0ABU8EY60_9GAMM|nr:transcriptional regulator BetI [Pseudoalteromonas spongiae]ATD00599.1 TetR/AcrR family transcriptional regulator [Pseudoalteromonas spongiae UST010723-006]MEC8327081.1 transcriptional regulator BetI [Pseudomonadota bacterium]